MDCVIRSARPDDFNTISDVLRESFGPDMFRGQSYTAFRQWAYEDNPDKKPAASTEWVVEHNDEIVAARGVMPAKIVIEGDPEPTSWMQNVAVRPQARRQGVSRKIFRHVVRENGGMTMCLGMVEASRALARSEGVKFLQADEIVVLPLDNRRAVKRGAKAVLKRQGDDGLATLLSPVRKFGPARCGRHGGPRWVDIEPVELFEASFDEPLAAITAQFPAMMSRSAAKLNWFLACPMVKTSAFVAKRGGEPVGYAIYREDGAILDLLAAPDDRETIDALLAYLIQTARCGGRSQLLALLPPMPAMAACYRRRGFLTLLKGFGFYYTYPETARRVAAIEDPHNWYLGLADSDLCTFHQEW